MAKRRFALIVALVAVLVATVLAAGATPEPAAIGRVTTGRRTQRLRAALVVTEIALAGVLCAGTIQLWRHHRALATQDLGFRAASVLTFRVTVPVPGETPRGVVGARLEDLRQEIQQLQAVEAVGAATNLPWSGYDENADLTVLGREVPKGMDTTIRYQAATAGFVEAAGCTSCADAPSTPRRTPRASP